METSTSGGGHRHHDSVVLPDGSTVMACSFPWDGYDAHAPLDFGLYLDSRWRPPWAHEHLDWPDFGLPSDPRAMDTALDGLLQRAGNGEVVAIGCLGGHGRTGTAIAVLAVKAGLADDPVEWVRACYCDRAIETPEQEALVLAYQSREW